MLFGQPKGPVGPVGVFGGLGVALVALDQFTKGAVAAYLPVGAMVEVTPFFDLVHWLNRGAAFGFLNNADTTWQTVFFSAAALVAVAVLALMAARLDEHEKTAAVPLALVAGGAVGNLVDRLRDGAVVDFLYVHYKSFEWPAFNVADIGISIGCLWLAWTFWRQPKPTDGASGPARA